MANEYAEDFFDTCKDVIAMELDKNGDLSIEALDKLYGSQKINDIIENAAENYVSGLPYDDQMAIIMSDKNGKYIGIDGIKESIKAYENAVGSLPNTAKSFIENVSAYTIERSVRDRFSQYSVETNNDILRRCGVIV